MPASRLDFKRSNLAALAIAAAFVIAAAVIDRSDESVNILFFAVVQVIPLALIWFPETLGEFTGYMGHRQIDTTTHPRIVAAAGWFILFGMFGMFLWFTSWQVAVPE